MTAQQVQQTRGRVETPMTVDWPELAAAQQPPWPDPVVLADAVGRLRKLPPLVFAGECDQLTERLAAVTDHTELHALGSDLAAAQAELDDLESRWLELAELQST